MNDAYPQIYNRKALGNLIHGRARRIYVMGKAEVPRTFSESSTYILALFIQSSEYNGKFF
jgi:hypothetical protein